MFVHADLTMYISQLNTMQFILILVSLQKVLTHSQRNLHLKSMVCHQKVVSHSIVHLIERHLITLILQQQVLQKVHRDLESILHTMQMSISTLHSLQRVRKTSLKMVHQLTKLAFTSSITNLTLHMTQAQVFM